MMNRLLLRPVITVHVIYKEKMMKKSKILIWTIHGALGSEQEFQTWNQLLKDKLVPHKSEIEIINITLPGHGARAGEKYAHVSQLTEDLAHTIGAHADRENAEHYLVGYSLGGYLALALLLQQNNDTQKARPSINGVYTYATKFYWSPDDVANFHQRLEISVIQKHEKMRTVFEKIHGREWPSAVECFHYLLDDIQKHPLLFKQCLNLFAEAKVRIAMGDQDKLADEKQFKQWQGDSTQNAVDFIQLKNSGHEWHKINQEAWADDVAHWLGDR